MKLSVEVMIMRFQSGKLSQNFKHALKICHLGKETYAKADKYILLFPPIDEEYKFGNTNL